MIEKPGTNRGQAIVELALSLPIFCIMLLGTLDFGVIYYNQAMLTNASREGARTAIQFLGKDINTGACNSVLQSDIDAAVDNYLSGRLINFGGAASWPPPQVTWTGDSPDCDASGGTVKVAVQYEHTYMLIPRFLGLGPTITLAAETTMNRE
jgi:Flp pilus assembly protein TadG